MTTWQIEDAPYQHWLEQVETPWRQSLRLPDVDVTEDASWPLISIVIPTFNTPPEFLRQALDSVLGQLYAKWELCIADDASTDPGVKEVIGSYLDRDARIRATFRPVNGGIAAASNSALALAGGDYIAFMDHDDVLPSHALALVARELRCEAGIQLLYSDSDNLNSRGERCNPFFKPDWNYELFLGQNYLNHLSVYRADLMVKLEGLREGLDGSQDYDLALRAAEHLSAAQIKHLSRILYHWRVLPSSVSQSNLGKAIKAGRKAVAGHLQRTGQHGWVRAARNALIFNRVDWQLPQPREQMLVLVHGEDEELIAATVTAIRSTSDYGGLQVKGLLTRLKTHQRPLGSELNGELLQAQEDLICIVPAGFFPESANWIQGMAGQLHRNRVGAVGAKTLASNDVLLGGPVATGLANSPDNTGLGRTFEGAHAADKGYFARLALDQEVSALHGACLATRRENFMRVNGFNPKLSSLALLGADLSFRLQECGLATIWSAHIQVRCSPSSAQSAFCSAPGGEELAHFRQLWSHRTHQDPWYNSNFSRSGSSYLLPA